MYNHIVNLIKQGKNIFITGSAGTGKSYILNQLRNDFPNMVITASTGAAAINVSGTTIHSYAGIGIGDRPADDIAWSLRQDTRRNILYCSLLAIDEISMLSAETLDLIDEVFQIVRQSKLPFGGIQVIVIGDFLQLPPVGEEAHFAFESKAWNFETVLLEKVYRQNDAEFLASLAKIRFGESAEIPSYPVDPHAIRLFALNRLADAYNLDKLRALTTKQQYYEAYDSGDPKGISTIYKNCLAPKDLYLKVGARVMLLVNKLDMGLVNGSIGEVINAEDEVEVRFDNGIVETFGKEIVARIMIDKVEIARRIQIPFRLAWGISIHKSQGLTLDKVYIDAQGIFECGQAYVALSRVRTKEGLSIVNLRPELIMANSKAVEFYKRRISDGYEISKS